MSHQVVIRPEAEDDLAQAFVWYEEHRLGLGHRFLLSVEVTLTAIRENPEAFPQVHRDIRRALVRRFPYGVFYVVEPSTVVVHAVFHASRDPKSWRERR